MCDPRGENWLVGRTCFEALVDPAMVIDADHRLIDLNGAAQALFGGIDALGKRCWEVLHGPEATGPMEKCPLVALLTSGQSKQVEMPVEAVAGTFLVTCSRLPGPEPLYLHIATDITARVQAEAELRRSEERFQKLFHLSPAAMTISGIEDGVVYAANEAFLALIGKPAAEVIGQSTSGLGIWADPAQRDAILKRIDARDEFRNEELSLLDHQGLPRTFVASGAKIQIGAREFLYVTAFDLTEQRNSERALMEALAEREGLYEHLLDGLIVADCESRRFVFANPAAGLMFGYPVSELIGKGIDAIHPAEALPEVLDHFARQSRGEEWVAPGLPCLRRDGTVFQADIATYTVRFHGRMCLVGLFRDAGPRLREEAALVRASKLEAVGLLAAGIAHDFNNLLGGLFGFIDLARTSLPQGGSLAGMLDQAMEAFKRARGLTEQLLTFAKGGKPVTRVMRIGGIVKETAQFALSGSPVRAEFHIANDLWPADVDERQLVQVISNLVLNARQAVSAGTIVVRSWNIPRSESIPHGMDLSHESPGCVCISVEDQGPGIPAEHLAKVFDPFFTTKLEGSGLGLTTVYSIVNRHGGRIDIDSSVGRGTTIRICLPAVREVAPTIVPRSETAPPRNEAAPTRNEAAREKVRVLVMDDERIVREVAMKMLNVLGYEADGSADGQEAINLYLKAQSSGRPYTLLILDLTVPGRRGGLDVIRELKAREPSVRAVVASGYSDDPVLASPESYGFVDRLEKPFRLADLSAVMVRALRSAVGSP